MLQSVWQNGICRQCRHRSDCSSGAVWSGPTLFAIPLSSLRDSCIKKKKKNKQKSMEWSVRNFRTFTVHVLAFIILATVFLLWFLVLHLLLSMFNKSNFLLISLKIAEWVANSINPDQMLHSVVWWDVAVEKNKGIGVHSFMVNYVPPLPKGRGTYFFGTDPVGVGISVSVKLLVRSVTWIPFGIFWWYLVEM